MQPKIVPFRVGEVLPFVVPDWIGSFAPNDPDSAACRVAFLVSTRCGFCARLASRYVDSLAARTPTLLRPVWLVLDGAAAASSWAEENRLPPRTVLPVRVKGRGLFRRPVTGHVWMTPMRLVLTPELLVMDARPADQIPGMAEYEALCASGGIAPGSLRELEAMALQNNW